MRIFKRYLPYMVAKHVKTYYQGFLYIHEFGRLEFQNGRLLMPEFVQHCLDKQKIERKELQSCVREINNMIIKMAADAA